jgi:hypothetical protein
VEIAESLNMSLDFCESSGRELVFWNPCVKDALELNVDVSQRLLGVALLKRVPHLFSRVLALDELGNVWRDAEVDITHHTLIVLILILLLLSSLVNLTLIGDILVSASDGNRDRGVQCC